MQILCFGLFIAVFSKFLRSISWVTKVVSFRLIFHSMQFCKLCWLCSICFWIAVCWTCISSLKAFICNFCLFSLKPRIKKKFNLLKFHTKFDVSMQFQWIKFFWEKLLKNFIGQNILDIDSKSSNSAKNQPFILLVYSKIELLSNFFNFQIERKIDADYIRRSKITFILKIFELESFRIIRY